MGYRAPSLRKQYWSWLRNNEEPAMGKSVLLAQETAHAKALGQKEAWRWRPNRCGQIDLGEVDGPCLAGVLVRHLDFISPVMEMLSEHYKQGSSPIKFMSWKVGSGWWVKNEHSQRKRGSRDASSAVRRVCSVEVKLERFRRSHHPHRPRLADMALGKATVICLWETSFGICGKGHTDMVKCFFFSPGSSGSHIWKIREIWKCISTLVATPSSCFVIRTLRMMPSMVYLQLRLPVLWHEEACLGGIFFQK